MVRAMFEFILAMFVSCLPSRRICITSSRRIIGRTKRNDNTTPNPTETGHIARNELDTHADTCCAGANWTVMEYTGEVCEVSPFLESYSPIEQIPVARCCTVWTDHDSGQEYLLVADQMLWFGTLLDNSLLNPNQIREYGISVSDNPFSKPYGIDGDDFFIPFQTTGMIVHFESRVPTEWEKTHLPVILLTAETWDPRSISLCSGQGRCEEAEMRKV